MGLRSFIHRLTAPKPNYNTPDGEIKLVLIVNHGLRMGKGKIAAQAGHASVNSVMKCGQQKAGITRPLAISRAEENMFEG